MRWTPRALCWIDAPSARHLAGERRPFPARLCSKPKMAARYRVVDIKHIRLDVTLDFKERANFRHRDSSASPQFLTASRNWNSIGAEMEIAAVRAGAKGRCVRSIPMGSCTLHWRKPLRRGRGDRGSRSTTRRVRGAVSYFVGPDDAYPNKPPEAWTQGEDEDSRYWFPCYDYPNECRVTSEIVATVPENFHRGFERAH